MQRRHTCLWYHLSWSGHLTRIKKVRSELYITTCDALWVLCFLAPEIRTCKTIVSWPRIWRTWCEKSSNMSPKAIKHLSVFWGDIVGQVAIHPALLRGVDSIETRVTISEWNLPHKKTSMSPENQYCSWKMYIFSLLTYLIFPSFRGHSFIFRGVQFEIPKLVIWSCRIEVTAVEDQLLEGLSCLDTFV